jgi:two-component system NarL family sensor kinase
VGWLLLGFGLSLSAAGVALAYTNYGVAEPDAPAAGLVAMYVPATIVTAIACNGLVLLLTPTGALPSPHWRWWAAVTAAAPVALLVVVTLFSRRGDRVARALSSPLDLHALDGGLVVAYRSAFAVTIIVVVVATASLVGRFRRARGIERQQLRWVAFATVLVALLAVGHLTALALGPMPWGHWWAVSIRRSCRRPSARPSSVIGCTTWTASSAAPSPMDC